MMSKPIPLLSGLTSLVVAIGCIIDNVVVGALLLVSISTYTKLGGSYLNQGKQFNMLIGLVGKPIYLEWVDSMFYWMCSFVNF